MYCLQYSCCVSHLQSISLQVVTPSAQEHLLQPSTARNQSPFA